MSDSIFNKDTIDMIVMKVRQDPTGKMSKLMQEIMNVCEKAGNKGFTMQELSIIATTGWYLSQSPELREMLDQMLGMTPPPEEYVKGEVLEKVKDAMEKVAKKTGIEGYCRIDAFVHIKTGEVIVIEINTTPALTPSTVLYHQALAEDTPVYPTAFLEALVSNKGY